MKDYRVTAHAIERAVERLGVAQQHARNHLRQLIQSAYYVGETVTAGNRKVRYFDHAKSRVRLVVGLDDSIVTVYRFPDEVSELKEAAPALPEAFADDIRQLVLRKVNAIKREHGRKKRALEIERAEVSLEIAQLELNHAKAKSPKTRATIKEQLSALITKRERIEYEMDAAETEYKRIIEGTGAFV